MSETLEMFQWYTSKPSETATDYMGKKRRVSVFPALFWPMWYIKDRRYAREDEAPLQFEPLNSVEFNQVQSSGSLLDFHSHFILVRRALCSLTGG